MKNKGNMLLLLGIMVFAQFFWLRENLNFDRELPFLSCLFVADTVQGNMLLTMYSYLPFPFFLLLFSGEMRQLIAGYGSLMVIRGRNKTSLLMTLMGKTCLQIAGVVLVMGMLYSIGKSEHWAEIGRSQQIQGLFMYAFTLIVMVQMQMLLELYMDEQYAYGMTMITGIVSIFASGTIGTRFAMVNLFLFPNLAFARKNGVLNEAHYNLSFETACLALIGIYLVLAFMTMQGFKRKDML